MLKLPFSYTSQVTIWQNFIVGMTGALPIIGVVSNVVRLKIIFKQN